MAPWDLLVVVLFLFVNIGWAFVLGISCGISSNRRTVTSTFHRIMGGSASTPGQWPWQVIIQERGDFECSGVIINKQWILTAAHCFDIGVWSISPLKYTVLTGEHDLSVKEGTEKIHNVSQIITHPVFDGVTTENDIALLKLSQPLKFNKNVQPVCLPSTNSVFTGHNCVVTGWGDTHYTGNPDVLRWVNVPVMDYRECRQKYPIHSRYHIFPTNICAGTRTKDSCAGDSGGPLACLSGGRFLVAGLVSWGENCGTSAPGVYTRVQSYLPWIDQIIKSR